MKFVYRLLGAVSEVGFAESIKNTVQKHQQPDCSCDGRLGHLVFASVGLVSG